MRHFRTIGTAWRVNLGETAPAEIATEQDLPRGQMIALLRVRVRTAGKDSLVAKALNFLCAGSDTPTTFDLTALRDAHYLRWNYQGGFDQILPPGSSAADAIARRIARDHLIHHVTFSFKQPRSNMGSFAACSCGEWRQTVGRKRGDDDRLRRYAADHLDLVKRGAWKRPRPIEEFINEVMPPLQLPLGGTAS